jgi:type IV pilus assembly protein PilA
MFSLPTAQQLQFPDTGAYGIKVDARGSMMSAELSFESNPLEILLNQDMSSIAVVGILAAIAIPAYNDYTIRASVAEGIGNSASLKAHIAKYYSQHNKFPGNQEIAKMQPPKTTSKYISNIAVIPDNGVIVITFANNAAITGKRIALIPVVEEKGVSWQCQAELSQKYLPAFCREKSPGKQR